MSIPTLLDHIVIAGPSLEELVDWFRDLTGVTAAPGGTHPVGTANALVALTVAGQRRNPDGGLLQRRLTQASAPPP